MAAEARLASGDRRETMNFKTTIGLLVLLLVGVGVLLLTRGRDAAGPKVEPSPAQSSKELFDSPPNEDELVRLVVERSDGSKLAFEKPADAGGAESGESGEKAEWQMVEPIRAPTTSWAAGNLATTFARLRYRSSFEPGQADAPSASAAGFEPPMATVTLVDKHGKEYRIEVGKKAPMSDDSYVRLAGKTTIYRAERDLVREVKKEVKEYREKRLLKLTADDARAVHLEHEGTTYDLVRGDGRDWVIDAPVKDHANADKVMALVRSLGTIYADEFVDDAPSDLARYGLDKPFLRLSVTTEKKREVKPAKPDEAAEAQPATQPAEPVYEIVRNTHALEIGGFADLKEQKRFVRLADQPWVATVPTSSLTAITPRLRELRDVSVVRVRKADVSELELTVGSESATVRRVEGRWQGSGDLAELDSAAIDEVLNALEDLKAVDWVDQGKPPGEVGLDKPRGVVRISATGLVEPVTLRIGGNTSSGRNTYVSVDGRPSLYVVDAEKADRLVVPPIALRSRTIFEPSGGRIVGLEVTRDRMRYALARGTGDDWTMSWPEGAKPDPAGVRELTTNLTSLRASRVVGKGDFATFNLPEPTVRVAFTFEQPAAPASGPATAPATQTASQPAGADAPSAPGTTGPAGESIAQAPPEAPSPRRSEHVLEVGRKSGVAFCRLADSPFVYELDETVWRVLTGELIDRKLFDFNADAIQAVSIVRPNEPLAFRRTQGGWEFVPDPTVELNGKKVTQFMEGLAGTRVEQYMVYSGADLSAEGFDNAPVQAEITLADGRTIRLKMMTDAPIGHPRRAALVDRGAVLLLREGDGDRLLNRLEQFVGPDAPPTPPPVEPEDEEE